LRHKRRGEMGEDVYDFGAMSVGAAWRRLERALGYRTNFAIAQGAEGELWVATAGGLYAAGFTPAAALVALVKLAERGVCDE
jgi:hypothetical protein